MLSKKQARKTPAKVIKRRMVDLEMSVTRLAGTVGHDIAVVSKAINHGHYPRVMAKIQEVLRA